MSFKTAALALLAASLFAGPAAAQSTTVAPAAGCYPAYAAGSSYQLDDYVSAGKTMEVTTQVACTFGTADPDCLPENCDCTTDVETSVVTCIDCTKEATEEVDITCNYRCADGVEGLWCSQAGFAPAGINPNPSYGEMAWDEVDCPCEGTQSPPTEPPPAPWSLGGCPAPYVPGTEYGTGEAAAVCTGEEEESYCLVYTCKDASPAPGKYCGMEGYAPGDGLHWEQAWTFEGSCTGTLGPTAAPSFDPANFVGGCAGPWEEGVEYEEGDRVSDGTMLFECKAWPEGAHCGQAGYEPAVDSATPDAWAVAWTAIGHCEGTVGPTAAPSYGELEDLGGCPPEWEARTAENPYEEGDAASANGIVFECNPSPMSNHCGQAGYEPIAGLAWRDAWTAIGHCSGTVVPTSSPTFDAATSVGACPPPWVAGDNTSYQMDDMVSVVVSTDPLRRVAFKCRGWPESGHCGQYAPDDPEGGPLGWIYAGPCEGSLGPTASPSFDLLTVDASGCPAEYDPEVTYAADDEVTLTVSTSPERKVKFRCRTGANAAYCNSDAFAPGEQYDYLGWTLLGACTGSLAPTVAPTPYDNSGGQCNYEQCRDVPTPTPCEYGAADPFCTWESCSCTGAGTEEDPEVCTGCSKVVVERVCTTQPVNSYGEDPSLSELFGGDVVRIGKRRYRCKESTGVYLWCRQAEYEPEANDLWWPSAWELDGECP